MKTVKIISLALILGISFNGLSQKKGNYFSAMAFQEFDLLSKNSPFGLSFSTKLGPLFLQADYRHSLGLTTQYQIMHPKDSYGGKIGYLGGALGPDGGVVFGFVAGMQKVQQYKRLTYDYNELPADLTGTTYEVMKIQVPVAYTQFSLGFTAMNVIVNDDKKMESIIDEFDLKLNKDKLRFQTIQMYIELLYSPKIEHSNTFSYSPFGYYIPRDLTLASPAKEKHFGAKLRVEYTTNTKMGIIIDMGVFPGIGHKTSGYNDFNFGVRFGGFVNLSTFTKKEKTSK